MDLAKRSTGQFSTDKDYTALREPKNIEEVEELIKKAMSINRIAEIHIGNHLSVPEWHAKFLEYLALLALKYRPWQFHWISQEDGQVDVKWVEVHEWLYKYKESE